MQNVTFAEIVSVKSVMRIAWGAIFYPPFSRLQPILTVTQSRYTVYDANGVSMLRIEPVRAGRDDAPYECVAENGVGDAVSAEATLTVYEGKWQVTYKVQKLCSPKQREGAHQQLLDLTNLPALIVVRKIETERKTPHRNVRCTDEPASNRGNLWLNFSRSSFYRASVSLWIPFSR